MLAMKALRLALGELLGADTGTLAPVAVNKIALVKANFALDENLLIGDLTLADFDGSTPLAASATGGLVGIDPITGDQIITIKDPAGGWRWETTGLTNLPQTIYGYALIDNAGATLLAAALFPDPIPLSAVGEQVSIGEATLTIVPAPIV
jgi:hypothetical protein